MKKEQITKEALQVLKTQLSYGAIKVISEELKISVEKVQETLSGEINPPDIEILEKAIEVRNRIFNN
jgi:energy-converting hydrogenase A subunit M